MSFGGGRGNGKDFNPDDFDFSGENSDEETTAAESAENTGESASSSRGFPSGDFTPPGDFPSGDFPADGQMPPGDFPSGDFTPPDGFDPGSFPGQPGENNGNDSSGSQTPSGGFTPPEGFEMPDEGFEMPEGFDFDGGFPGQPGEDSADKSGDETSASSDGKSSGRMSFGGMGMGSDDVKLKYIDDDPDSYSNIFDNAKTKVSESDKKRLINSLQKLSSYTDLEEVLDTDEVMRYFVVHNFVCNGDSYTGMMIHNYYLHESDGKLSMIPWDYNLAFGTFQGNNAASTVNTSIDSPISMGDVDDRPMLGWIFSDESYTEKYHELFSDFIEKWFTNGELEQL
ncbi:MAG: CotH kinase family protein, partial [Clostridia bacterium]|nr:CotH kinase family protein [Clostridia bacterium]